MLEEKHLGIFCHLERLRPVYEMGYVHFTLNIAPTWVNGLPGDADPLQRLKAWNWTIKAITLRKRKRGAAGTNASYPVVEYPELAPQRLRIVTSLEKALKANVLNEFAAKPVEALVWKPEAVQSGSGRTFRGLAGYVSTLAAPLPQAMQLSLCFRVPQGQVPEGADWELFAAPEIIIGSKEYTPADEQPAGLDVSSGETEPPLSAGRWRYAPKTAGDPEDVAAYVTAVPSLASDPTANDRFIDLSTYWIRNGAAGGGPTWQDGNWLLGYAERAAEGFDLARSLVDAFGHIADGAGQERWKSLRELFDADTAGSSDRLPRLRAVYLALLRDLAGVWLVPRANTPLRNADEVQRLLRSAVPEATPAEVQAFREELGRYAADAARVNLACWRDILQEVFPELRDLPLLAHPEVPRPLVELPLEFREMKRLHSTLAGETGLKAVVHEQWRRAADGSKEAKEFWDRHGAALGRWLEAQPRVRMQQALGNVGSAWNELVDLPPVSKDERADLGQNYTCELVRYFDARLHNAVVAGNRYADRFPRLADPGLPDPLLRFFREAIRQDGQQFFDDHVLPLRRGTGEAGDGSPTAVPHPVAVQVDALGDQPDAARDTLRRIAGVGVLMRRKKTTGAGDAWGPWRSLSLATLYAQGDINALWPVSLVASRITFQGDLKSAFITYNNEPLAARSPRACLAGDVDLRPTSTLPGDQDALSPLFYLRHPYVPGGPALRLLPELCFGHTYQVLSHVVGNGGALPSEIAVGHPARLREDSENFLLNGLLPGRAHTIHYLRRVRVGQPRMELPDRTSREAALPAIPEGVRPLSAEIGQELLTRSSARRRYFWNDLTRQGRLRGRAADGWSVEVDQIELSGLRTTSGSAFEIVLPSVGDPTKPLRLTVFNVTPAKLHVSLSWDATPVIPAKPLDRDLTFADVTRTVGFRIAARAAAAGMQRELVLFWREEGQEWQVVGKWAMLEDPDLKGSEVLVNLLDAAAESLIFARPTALVGSETFEADGGDRLALLMLTPDPGEAPAFAGSPVPSEFRFALRKPSTDLATWERWVAGDPGTRELRASTWAAFHQNAPDPDAPPLVNTADRTIDDPAADNSFLYVELVSIRGQYAGRKVTREIPLQAPPAIVPGHPKMDYVQAPRVPFECRCGRPQGTEAAFGMEWAPAPDGVPHVKILIPPGEIAVLAVHTPVRKDHFEARFHPDLRESAIPGTYPPGTDAAGMTHYLFSPLRLLIEGASDALPSQPQIWKGLVATYASAADRDRVRLRLERYTKELPAGERVLGDPAYPKGLDVRNFQPRAWDFVSRVVVHRQVWRWNGRMVTPFPFAHAPVYADQNGNSLATREIDRLPAQVLDPAVASPGDSPESNVFLWDAEGFGDRDEADRLESAAFISARETPSLLFEEDITTDRRALYYRFSAVAQSRYEGLCLPAQRSRLRRQAARPSYHPTAGEGVDHWRRLLVPCRFEGKVPKPAIRFIIPLTEGEALPESSGAGAGKRLPGLLVALGEPWYTHGGLAESLRGDVALVEAPYCSENGAPPPAQTRLLNEFGPDPILVGRPPQGLVCDPPLGSGRPPRELSFAIGTPGGFTSDTEFTETPLFHGSWFILPSPDISPALSPEVDLSWYFARIQFHRHIERAQSAADSESTNAVWVQYLPDALAFHPALAQDRLFLTHAPGAHGEFQLWELPERAVPQQAPVPRRTALQLDPNATPYHLFVHWLLLTQVRRDIRGRRDQEQYIGLYRQDLEGADAVFRPLAGNGSSLAGDLRGRVVEVQYRLESLWSDPQRRMQRLEGAYYTDVPSLDPEGKGEWTLTLGAIDPSVAPNAALFLTLYSQWGTTPMDRVRAFELETRFTAAGRVQFSFRTADGNPVSSPDMPTRDEPFDVCVKLTHQDGGWSCVPEFRARNSGWVSIFPPAPALVTRDRAVGGVTVRLEPAPGGGCSTVRYLPPSLTTEPWDHLFPLRQSEALPLDAAARIVRMSQPIPLRPMPL